MNLKDYAPSVNQTEYREWRLNGMAFETRLATGTVPNRTMGSFIPGKARKTRDSILVRGYWGDTINSPFIPFGNEVWKEPERTKFFRKVNYQSVYSNCDVSEYNVQSYIVKLEDLKEYDFPFERLKQILGDKYDELTEEQKKAKAEAEKKKKQEEESKKKNKKKKEKVVEEEPMIQEITDEEAKKIEDEKNQIVESKLNEGEDIEQKLMNGEKTIDLSQINEGASTQASEEEGSRRLLPGFINANVKIHLLSDDIEKLFTKQKYAELFDIGCLSITSANNVGKEEIDLNKLFKKGASVHVESSDTLVILKKE
eukprot:CAMPEP_0168617932 /NCGR_PEP_ID=MMETSP0449_2-20121227/5803_1 /TAXON_ID=1082188 /ORGANISM="Strombidium rassoulzadegani, Strain ras09" /LENGTH=311 /DNA_ID=CAMNT_0008658775 /DNA_START=147 /DNA_END=1082 /DNA_ORIENTATION=+